MSSLVLPFLDLIFINLAGNKDNHKSLDEVEFLLDAMTNY